MILYNSENGIRDIRPFFRPLFSHSNVVKYTSCLLGQWTWNETRLPNITETSPLNLLPGSSPACNKHRLPQVSEVQMFNKFLFCCESLVESTSGVAGEDASAPQKFWFVENPGKTPENLGRNPWKFRQKWCPNVVWKLRPTFAEKKMKILFWKSHQKRSSWSFCGKICRQKSHKNFSSKFGKIRSKIPQNLLAPTPMKSTIVLASQFINVFNILLLIVNEDSISKNSTKTTEWSCLQLKTILDNFTRLRITKCSTLELNCWDWRRLNHFKLLYQSFCLYPSNRPMQSILNMLTAFAVKALCGMLSCDHKWQNT